MPDHKGNVMNKAQLVDAIAAKADLSKAQAKVALEAPVFRYQTGRATTRATAHTVLPRGR